MALFSTLRDWWSKRGGLEIRKFGITKKFLWASLRSSRDPSISYPKSSDLLWAPFLILQILYGGFQVIPYGSKLQLVNKVVLSCSIRLCQPAM